MRYETDTLTVMVSGFGLSDEVLEQCAIGVCIGLQVKFHSPFIPVIVKNNDDDFFGSSRNIEFKYNVRV